MTEEEKAADKKVIDHPERYGGDTVYECIKVLKAWCKPEEYQGFLKCNAIKYLCRVGKKDDTLQELKKARWYLEKLIETYEPKTQEQKEIIDCKNDVETLENCLKNCRCKKIYKKTLFENEQLKKDLEAEKKLNEEIKLRFVKCNTCTPEMKKNCLMFSENICEGERCTELVDIVQLVCGDKKNG